MNSQVSGHILIVDDQANWREALTSLLSIEGFHVIAVATFEEAKHMLSQEAFDLIILDVRLSDADTFDVQGIELLRQAKSQTPNPKAIILTGYPESVRSGVPERYGADAFLLKVPPHLAFDTKGFRETVKRLIRESRLKQSSSD
jgi:DNA-binding NtrC family response regulator